MDMEMVLNKQFLRNILFLLLTICLLVFKVQAQAPQYCNGNSNSYPIHFQGNYEILPDSDTTISSVIYLIATKYMNLTDAVINYQLYYAQGSPISELVPYKQDTTSLIVTTNQQFQIQHSHRWPTTPTPTSFKTQITSKAGSVLICMNIPIMSS